MIRIAAVCLLGVPLVAFLTRTGEREKQELEVVRKLAETTPEFPGFKSDRFDNVVLKRGKVSLSRGYKSYNEFSEIRQYYNELLVPRGWTAEVPPPSIIVGEQKYVYYKRGEYSIGLMQDNSEPNRFGLVFEWYAR
jgi:hypothetical protein